MIYGISTTHAGRVDVVRWPNRRRRIAIEWADGGEFTGDRFITRPGRRLYQMPHGWRPAKVSGRTLSVQIVKAGRQIMPEEDKQ